jgi:hypothetical protein
MRQVYACGKNLAAAISGMVHHAAAQHANFAHRIEHGDVSGGLRVIKRVVIFRIEKSRIADRDDRRFPLSLDLGAAKIDCAAVDELSHALKRFRLRKQHRFAQMHACVRYREDLREENTLIDFDPVFFGLHQRTFGVDLLACRRQSRDQPGGAIDEIIDAHKIGEISRQLAVDGPGMPLQKIFPCPSTS